jgi:hypothetical protein
VDRVGVKTKTRAGVGVEMEIKVNDFMSYIVV